MEITILLADDHEIVRDGFRGLLSRRADMHVVAEASNGREAVEQVAEHQPDVAIMDVSMPELNGVEATRQIVRDHPQTRVLGLSMHPASRIVKEMLRAGATGYIVKTCHAEELVEAVRAVSEGKTYLSPEIAGTVVNDLLKETAGEQAPREDTPLSERERQVLQLLAEGKTTKEMAAVLHVTPKTVETHRYSLMKKLDIHSVAGLTKYAVREGLTPLDSL